MSFKSKLARNIGAGIACFFVATMIVGCDESYDFSKLGGDISLFENGISLPVESDVKITVSELLTNEEMGDMIVIDEQGRYSLNFSGTVDPVQFDVPVVYFETIDPTIASAHLDFMESIENDPVFGPMLEVLGYQGGALPEIPELVVPENVVHAPIVDATEEYDFSINDIPEELISVSSITLAEGAVATLSLHAEGFPTDIDSVAFEFILHAPSQMVIHPEEKDIWKDDKGYFHIEHQLPCIDGKLDDEVHFYIDSLVFEPAISRSENGTIDIESELQYSGTVHITESFYMGGWVPQLDLNVGFKMDGSSVKSVTATVQADVDDVAIEQEITNVPDLLSAPNTCLDLQQVYVCLNVDNQVPLPLYADIEMQSTFFNGTTSPVIATEEPVHIAASLAQEVVITNDAQYSGENVTIIPNLPELVKSVPQSVKLKAAPYVPVTEVTLELDKTYSVDMSYALQIPIVVGDEVSLYYEEAMEGISEDLRSVTTYISCAQIQGVLESTLPVDVDLELFAVDKNGTVMKEITMSGALTAKAGQTNPFNVRLDIVPEEATFNKLDKIILTVSATSDKVRELRPEQYLRLKNLALRLPGGVKVAEL